MPNDHQGPPDVLLVGLNAVMLLGSALGLMNSSASWRPWMQGLGGHSGENGEGGGSGGSSRGGGIEDEDKPSTRKRFLH